MSSILKALKKLESEKAARKPDSFRIDSEILRGETRSRLSPLTIILAGMLLFAGGMIATYLYMKREPDRAASGRATTTPVVATERIVPEAIVPAPPSAAQTRITPEAPASPPLSKPNPPAAQHPRVKPSGSGIGGARSIPAPQAPSAAAGHPVAPAKPVQPLLRVTGIAFQDGVDSVAMINGVQVVKGSAIEGVRVVEIKRDRVVFDQNGEIFDVGLGKSNR